MIKYYFLLITIIFTSIFAKSQDSSKYSLGIRFAPLSILDPARTTIQPGLEIIFKNKISFGLDYGFQFDKIFYQKYEYKKNREYFKLRTEVKYFIHTEKTSKGNTYSYYSGFQFFYIPDKYNVANDWYKVDKYTIYYETALIDKYALGFLIEAGYEIHFNNKFVLDFHLAGGYKYRVHNTRATKITITEDFIREHIFSSPDQHPGVRKLPFFTLIFKIGYLLFSKYEK
jgi:hypothetical protein